MNDQITEVTERADDGDVDKINQQTTQKVNWKGFITRPGQGNHDWKNKHEDAPDARVINIEEATRNGCPNG